jgi:ADP-heptose:LPS heptosyltransferase
LKNSPKVLIILPRQLGDILLGTPLLRALKLLHPNCQISWVSHKMGKQILETNALIQEVFYLPEPPAGENFVTTFLKRVWLELNFLMRVRKARFDIVIDALNNPRTSILSFSSAAPLRVSFTTRFFRNMAFHKLLPRSNMNTGYVAFEKIKLLNTFNSESQLQKIDKELLNPILETNLQDENVVENWLAKVDLTGRKFLVLSPTSRRELRKWPRENFLEFSKLFVQKFQIPIVWIWGPGEKEEVEKYHSELSSAHKEYSLFPPLFKLREVGVLCRKSIGFLGLTNGLAHIACASGAKTIQIHGPTKMESWVHPNKLMHGGIQANHFVSKQSICVSCEKHECQFSKNSPQFQECLTSITPLEVLDVCQELFVPMDS